MALSNAERQRAFRERRREERKGDMLPVRGKDGEFDERIRIALAIKDMFADGILTPEIVEHIMEYSVQAIRVDDLVQKKFLKKILREYITGGDCDE